MNILIVTPAPRGSVKGNRITAERWKDILRELGHQVKVAEAVKQSAQFDLLVALHARKSARSIRQFRNHHPDRPIIVAMTGTDLHVDLKKTGVVENSLELVDRIVMLESEGMKRLKARFRKRCRVIYQSAVPVNKARPKLKRSFEVTLIGHLRPVKDPFRMAKAVKLLPAESKVTVVHIGTALTASMERQALWETKNNPRYRWLGRLSHGETQHRLARSRLTVVSSRVEGAPSVISEAVVNRVPVLASRIDGTVGTLGVDYPGFFKFGDTKALAQLTLKSERDPKFYALLQRETVKLKSRFSRKREIESWRNLISELS